MRTQTYGVDAVMVRKQKTLYGNYGIHPALHDVLSCAHKQTGYNWTMRYLKSAYNDYRINRENGEAQDNPSGELKYDGKAVWDLQPDGYYHVKYTEGPNDKLWMEAKDRNSVFRLEREGRLDELEPNLRTEVPKLHEEIMTYRAKRATEAKARTEVEAKERKAEEGRNAIELCEQKIIKDISRTFAGQQLLEEKIIGRREEKVIQGLYQEFTREGLSNTTNANQLNLIIEESLGTVQAFLYELLQNADDVRAKIVDIYYQNDYLIFSHDGEHFADNNVRRICTAAARSDTTRVGDNETTGYKGIGFKSVFIISDWVLIYSNNFVFRFDKQMVSTIPKKSEQSLFPWQIIPIWTDVNDVAQVSESLKSLLKPLIDKGRVVFAIRANESRADNIKQCMRSLVSCAENILFLRHVISLELILDDKYYDIKVDKFDATEQLTQEWKLSLSMWEGQQLKEQRILQCKYFEKIAQGKKIQALIDVTEGNIKPVRKELPELFCFLPTTVSVKLPLLINADFALDLRRAELVCDENKKNIFLLQEIAKFYFEILVQLAQDSLFKYQVLKLLYRPALSEVSARLKHHTLADAYFSVFQDYYKNTMFILSHDETKYLTIDEAVIDPHNFYIAFSSIKKPLYMKMAQLVSNKLEGAKECSLIKCVDSDIIFREVRALAGVLADYSEDYRKIVEWLFERYHHHPWGKYLYETLPFLLSESGKFRSPKELCLPSSMPVQPPKGFQLEVVHAKVLEIEGIYNWLKNELSLKVISLSTVLEKIIQALSEEKQEVPQHIALLKYVFHEGFLNKKLTKSHFSYLARIFILDGASHFQKPSNCYLPQNYRPIFQVDFALPPELLVSAEYIREINNADILESWRQFFYQIGCRKSILRYFDEKEVSVASIEKIPFARDYPAYIFSQYEISESGRALKDKHKESHRIKSFLYFDFMDLLGKDVNYTDLFFETLVKHWDKILEANQAVKYIWPAHSHGKPIKSFLEYYFEYKVKFCVFDNKVLPAREIYAPCLKELIGEATLDRFPMISYLPDNLLSFEQAKFVGFKTALSIDDILYLLKEMKNLPISQTLILRQEKLLLDLLETCHEPLSSGRINSICLLSANNTLQSVLKMRLFSGENLPYGDCWLKHYLGLSLEQLLQVCHLFRIEVVEQLENLFEPLNPTINEIAYQQIKDALPGLAIIQARAYTKAEKEILTNFAKKMQRIQIFDVAGFKTNDSEYKSLCASIKCFMCGNTLYCCGRFTTTIMLNKIAPCLKKYFSLCCADSEIANIISNANDKGELQSLLQVDDKTYRDVELLAQQLVEEYSCTLPSESDVDAPTCDIEQKLPAQLGSSPQLPLLPDSPEFMSSGADLDDEQDDFSSEFKRQCNVNDTSPHIISALPIVKTPQVCRLKRVDSNSDDEIVSDFDEEKFSPKFTPANINYGHYDFERSRVRSNIRSRITKDRPERKEMVQQVGISPGINHSARKQRKQRGNIDIGYWGEGFIFRMLQEKYTRKSKWVTKFYGNNFSPAQNGGEFSISWAHQDNPSIVVVWLNADQESGNPFDIRVEKTSGGKTKIRFFDVKTTVGESVDMWMSSGEYKFAQEKKDQYGIFRVFKAGEKDAYYKKYKKPLEQFVITPVKYRMLLGP